MEKVKVEADASIALYHGGDSMKQGLCYYLAYIKDKPMKDIGNIHI